VEATHQLDDRRRKTAMDAAGLLPGFTGMAVHDGLAAHLTTPPKHSLFCATPHTCVSWNPGKWQVLIRHALAPRWPMRPAMSTGTLMSSTGACFYWCFSAGFQGRYTYYAGGQHGISTPGINIGWADREFPKHARSCRGAGGGIEYGVYGCVGGRHGDDWEYGGADPGRLRRASRDGALASAPIVGPVG
jgi:hypothetical protein